jgi:hypothetical protein
MVNGLLVTSTSNQGSPNGAATTSRLGTDD